MESVIVVTDTSLEHHAAAMLIYQFVISIAFEASDSPLQHRPVQV